MLPTSLRSYRVFYVEDEPLIAMDGEAMLRDIGFSSIVVALTFADAAAILRDHRFDLALMDINLGCGQTSLPLAAMLHSGGSRIIFASGYNSAKEDVTQRYGPRIEKPFDEATLLKTVLAATAERQAAPPRQGKS